MALTGPSSRERCGFPCPFVDAPPPSLSSSVTGHAFSAPAPHVDGPLTVANDWATAASAPQDLALLPTSTGRHQDFMSVTAPQGVSALSAAANDEEALARSRRSVSDHPGHPQSPLPPMSSLCGVPLVCPFSDETLHEPSAGRLPQLPRASLQCWAGDGGEGSMSASGMATSTLSRLPPATFSTTSVAASAPAAPCIDDSSLWETTAAAELALPEMALCSFPAADDLDDTTTVMTAPSPMHCTSSGLAGDPAGSVSAPQPHLWERYDAAMKESGAPRPLSTHPQRMSPFSTVVPPQQANAAVNAPPMSPSERTAERSLHRGSCDTQRHAVLSQTAMEGSSSRVNYSSPPLAGGRQQSDAFSANGPMTPWGSATEARTTTHNDRRRFSGGAGSLSLSDRDNTGGMSFGDVPPHCAPSSGSYSGVGGGRPNSSATGHHYHHQQHHGGNSGGRGGPQHSYTKLFVGQLPLISGVEAWLADVFQPYGVREIVVRTKKHRHTAFLWCRSRGSAEAAVRELHNARYNTELGWFALCVEQAHARQ